MERNRRILILVSAVLSVLTACASYSHKSPERPAPPPPSSAEAPEFSQKGLASWYGPGFYGRKTASGARFKKHLFTCAHRTLPFGTELLVTNLENGKTVQVTVNDRGPFIRNKIVDLSFAAAKEIGMLKRGSAKVLLETPAVLTTAAAADEKALVLPHAADLSLEGTPNTGDMQNAKPGAVRSARSIEEIIQESNQ